MVKKSSTIIGWTVTLYYEEKEEGRQVPLDTSCQIVKAIEYLGFKKARFVIIPYSYATTGSPHIHDFTILASPEDCHTLVKMYRKAGIEVKQYEGR